MIDDDDAEYVDELPLAPRKTIPQADLLLLEMAAYAMGAVRVEEIDGEGYLNVHMADGIVMFAWNPFVHSDDAFLLAADLGLQVITDARTAAGESCVAVADAGGRQLAEELSTGDRRAAARRAVVHAGAAIFTLRKGLTLPPS